MTMRRQEWVLVAVHSFLTISFAWRTVVDDGTFWRYLNAALAVAGCVVVYLQLRDARRAHRVSRIEARQTADMDCQVGQSIDQS